MFYLPVKLADPEMGQPFLHISNNGYVKSSDGTHAPLNDDYSGGYDRMISERIIDVPVKRRKYIE